MMGEKQLMLHELLKEEQEPFDLKSFISDKRSQLTNNKNSSSPPPKQQRRQKSKQVKNNAGFGFFGSFLKILKDPRKNSRLFVRNCDDDDEEGHTTTDDITISCSDEKMMIYGDFELFQTRFCASPFIFCTPESCSPAASPCRRRQVNQEKKIFEHSDNGNGVDEKEKEKCSPVSVLDLFFEDDEHKSINAEEDDDDDDDDYDLESSYANVQRAKQQLLERLRRFEKLAELDPMELERKFLEDEDYQRDQSSVASSEDREPSISLSPDVKQSVDRFLNDAFCLSNLQRKMCTDSITIEKKNKEFVLELDMVDLDFKRGFEGHETTVEEIELAVFGYLVEELLQEFNWNV